MPYRSPRWIWAGRLIFVLMLAGVIVYLVVAGLDKADKVASSAGVVIALCALAAPYLLPPAPPVPPVSPAPAGPVTVHASGAGGVAVGGDSSGEISTEVSGVVPPSVVPPAGPGVTASGTGSVALGGSNTGTIRTKITGSGGGGTAP